MKKNYWPMAIVGIIFFGIVIISVGVTIAVKNPVVDEEMYGGKKRDIDEHINAILQEQRGFESSARAVLCMGGEELVLQTPYLIKAPRKNTTSPNFTLPLEVRIDTQSPITIQSVDLVITSVMQGVADTQPIALSTDSTQADSHIYRPSTPLVFAQDGRYKLRFHIRYTRDVGSLAGEGDIVKSAYFEQEVFYASTHNP